MPERIEILGLPVDQCWNFIPAVLPDYVDTVAVGAANLRLQNPIGYNKFQKGDSMHILSCGLIIRESFTLWKDPAVRTDPFPFMEIAPQGFSSGDYYNNPNMQSSRIHIPMINYEMVADIFLDTTISESLTTPGQFLTSEDFYLTCFQSTISISMKGVPATLAGLTFYVEPFVKVSHNLPMIP